MEHLGIEMYFSKQHFGWADFFGATSRASSWASCCSDCRRHSQNERLGLYQKTLWLMIIRNYSYKFLVVTLIESWWVIFFESPPKSRVILNQFKFILTQKLLTTMFATKYSPRKPHGHGCDHFQLPANSGKIKPSKKLKKSFWRKTHSSLGFAVGVLASWIFSVYPCWMLKCKKGGPEKKMELGIANDSIPWKFRKSIWNMQSSYLDDTPPYLKMGAS